MSEKRRVQFYEQVRPCQNIKCPRLVGCVIRRLSIDSCQHPACYGSVVNISVNQSSADFQIVCRAESHIRRLSGTPNAALTNSSMTANDFGLAMKQRLRPTELRYLWIVAFCPRIRRPRPTAQATYVSPHVLLSGPAQNCSTEHVQLNRHLSIMGLG